MTADLSEISQDRYLTTTTTTNHRYILYILTTYILTVEYIYILHLYADLGDIVPGNKLSAISFWVT